MKILVADPISLKGVELLKNEGLDVVFKTGLTHSELKTEIVGYTGLIVRSETKVSEEVISQGQKLQVIGRAGVGLDNIDVDAATKRGIIVMNTPDGNTNTTAEHALAMLLSLARHIPQATFSLKSDRWEKKRFIGVEILGKTLGIIGLGRIGSSLAKKVLALGMKVIAFDPYISNEIARQMGTRLVELEKLLSESDFISVHVPNTEQTFRMLSHKEFQRVKKGARIINCARGGIIDEEALFQAIKSGQIAGAALDVFEKEPPHANPLLKLDEVVCTPHLGASTEEAQEKVAIAIAQQFVDYFKKGEIYNAVNLPALDAGTLEVLSPYLELAEKLGTINAHLVGGGGKEVAVHYYGEICELALKPITLAVLKGILQPFLKETVNMVNAPVLAMERGIKVTESTTSERETYASLIEIKLVTQKGEGTISGTLFEKKVPRILSIDHYQLEAIPSPNMLIFSNLDTPGVIGSIGTILGRNNINIAGMHLGRTAPEGLAMCIVNVDNPVPEEVLQEIRSLPTIFSAKMIRL
ncbi:MAG: phosphoglycerate dehydrogenase [Candidatus Tectomicrobia bacterium]|uniref:D-3-phosphoglycerate dehydrogenase n=1 Tax=Tectimicrobiota bacterium TaxID=2528274 RepID=A0A933GLM9_UNCTE|nr:phosphoglycerate dehydrogenase [Candidatus Tectomicrobia bacterium]